MTVRAYQITATASGAAGSATGSGTSSAPVMGELLAVYLDYTDLPATTDVTLAHVTPARTLLTVTNNATDGWYTPRASAVDSTNTAITGSFTEIPLAGYVTVTIAQGDPAGTVVATLLVDE